MNLSTYPRKYYFNQQQLQQCNKQIIVNIQNIDLLFTLKLSERQMAVVYFVFGVQRVIKS